MLESLSQAVGICIISVSGRWNLYYVGISVSGRQPCNSGVTALLARISPALTALVHFALLLLYVEKNGL